jgi:hypothetical protein
MYGVSPLAAMFHMLISRMARNMVRLLCCVVLICTASTSFAHCPDRSHKPVHQRVDCIGPLGNRLPISYRRRYNRPRMVCGWLAYWTEPTSQEAMAWHNAVHRGTYKKKMRTEMQYFYPKPWEAMRIGARTAASDASLPPDGPETIEAGPAEPFDDQQLPASVIDVLQMNEPTE